MTGLKTRRKILYRSVVLALCGILLCGMADFILSLSGQFYLKRQLVAFQQQSGCTLRATKQTSYPGIFFNPSVQLSGASERCSEKELFFAENVRLGFSPFHPFSAVLRLEGGEKLGLSLSSKQSDVWQMAGAPVELLLPLRGVFPLSAQDIAFSADFITLSSRQGVLAQHALSLRQVKGRMLINPKAEADKRIAGLHITAQKLNIAPGQHVLTNVSVVVTIPGPLSERRQSWQRLLRSTGDVAEQKEGNSGSEPVTAAQALPDILIPQAEADWQGLHMTWAAKLFVLEHEGLSGDSWLTLTSFRPFFEQLRHDNIVPEQQQEIMTKLDAVLSRNEKTKPRSVTLFVPVRHSEIVFAGYSAGSLLSALHTAEGLMQGRQADTTVSH